MPKETEYNRYNAYHHRKRELLGNQAGRPAPAWKVNQQERVAMGQQAQRTLPGSKIMLSRLPHDVGEDEVQALFAKTVGPVQDAFIVYNSQGNSKGMAVVSFHRSGDAAIARQKYNGKIIDGRRPIKIEIVKDEDETPNVPQAKPAVPSLLDRLGGKATPPVTQPPQPTQQPRRAPAAAKQASAPAVPVNARRKAGRQKKGPKRVNKSRVKVTAAQLDAEMEAYRAGGSAEEDFKM